MAVALSVVLVTGPPGVGKTTSLLEVVRSIDAVERFAVRDYGFRLALEGHPLGLRTVNTLRRFEMLTDQEVNLYFQHFLDLLPATKQAIAVEGYPKTAPQCADLMVTLRETGAAVTAFVVVEAPDEVLLQRVASRRICPECGVPTGSPESVCADCSVPGIPRADDAIARHRGRILQYRQSEKLVERFFADRGLLVTIDGQAPPHAVTGQLRGVFVRACGAST
jgi:adenylate kinase